FPLWIVYALAQMLRMLSNKPYKPSPFIFGSIFFQSFSPVPVPLVPTSQWMNLRPSLSTAIHIQQ
ncbi:MAG: hypothetical protein NZ551_08070, partial [Microscillaceae bacterium]|nr:hypothetical protein [Microscillaceae bacterium]MDW8461153.1 hypothetical protein [Cytophagales bacterium]